MSGSSVSSQYFPSLLVVTSRATPKFTKISNSNPPNLQQNGFSPLQIRSRERTFGHVPIWKSEALPFCPQITKRILEFVEPITVPKQVLCRFMNIILVRPRRLLVRLNELNQPRVSVQFLESIHKQHLLRIRQRVPRFAHSPLFGTCDDGESVYKNRMTMSVYTVYVWFEMGLLFRKRQNVWIYPVIGEMV